MSKELRAKELALECSVIAFFVVTLAGMLAGAESWVAALRGLGAGALVAFGGRFPARVFLEAAEPPAEEASQEEPRSPAAEAPARGHRAA